LGGLEDGLNSAVTASKGENPIAPRTHQKQKCRPLNPQKGQKQHRSHTSGPGMKFRTGG
jgi:hypothetical protein